MTRAHEAEPEVMSEQPTATLREQPLGGWRKGQSDWYLRPTNRVWTEPWWRFRHRHLAVQFAARRGIRIEGDGR